MGNLLNIEKVLRLVFVFEIHELDGVGNSDVYDHTPGKWVQGIKRNRDTALYCV